MEVEWPDTKNWPICITCHNRNIERRHIMIVLNMNSKMIHYQGDGSRDGVTECGREATEDNWLYPL